MTCEAAWPPTPMRTGRWWALLLAVALAVSFAQSYFFAHTLVPDVDEAVYMFLGRAALTGHVSLFQDELIGHRVPLPYYFIGLSQLAWPGSLVAARLFSAALGSACLVLVFLVARRLGGDLSGILAFGFAAAQSVVIGYFAYASYHSLVSLLLLAATYLYLSTDLPYRRVLAMVSVSAVFFARATMVPVIPLALLVLLLDTKEARERLALIAVTVLPPLAWFLYDPEHLKLLAHVPVLHQLVLPLGYQSHAYLAPAFPHEPESGAALLNAARLLLRWYKVWVLAAGALMLALAARALRGRPVREIVGDRGVTLIGSAVLFLALCQLAIFHGSPSMAVGYFPTFAVLAAVCLGVGFGRLLEHSGRGALRALLVLFLFAAFLAGPAASPPPTLPLAVSWRHSPVQALYAVSAGVERAIPQGARVFHIGATQVLYTAGRAPYLRQVFDVWTLAPRVDERIKRRSGLWDDGDIQEWLGRDAAYAVIVPRYLASHLAAPGGPLHESFGLIERLLERNFSRVAVLDQYSGLVYLVYKRKGRA